MKLQQIADMIAELNLEDEQARMLLTAMDEWSQKYRGTYNRLRAIPGFRKLWDAIETACQMSVDCEYDPATMEPK